MMELIQIIIIVFALFALSRVILRFKDGVVTPKELAFWSFIWAAIILVASVPNITFIFSNFAGIGRGVDFMLYVAVILIFYLVFRIYVKMEKMEHEITTVVREIALKKK